ncbi:MAG: DUF6268 family outer membrane beta-barrel protein, partial [Balneolaceae bacterium]
TFTGAVYLSNYRNPHFNYQYGIAYVRQVNGNFIMPVFGFDWQPTEYFEMDAMDPLEPDMTYTISNNLGIGLTYKWEECIFKLNREAQSRYVRERQSELIPHLDLTLMKNWVLSTKMGYRFRKSIDLYDNVETSTTWFDWGDNPVMQSKQQGWFFELSLAFEISGKK